MSSLILAGPIIRRVELERFWIWIAHSARLTLRAEIEMFIRDMRGRWVRSEFNFVSSCTTLRVGQHLYVSLVKVEAKTPLARGARIVYRLRDADGSSEVNTALQRRAASISSSPLQFCVPFTRSGTSLEIAHFSCRRLLRSRNDAVRGLARTLRDKLANQLETTHLLVLGGDQIYADDVESKVLSDVIALEKELFEVRDSKVDRPGFVRSAGFTTQEDKTHLIRFSELACLYLLSWSTEVNKRQSMRTEIEQWQVVLASIATYMIFDDHEVTDDWMIDTAWKTSVEKRKEGARYIDDALVAYFVFQGWGNDPAATTPEVLQLVQRWLDQHSAQSRPPSPLGLSSQWSYCVPSDYLILCIDCRTKRTSPDVDWITYVPATGDSYTGKALDPVLIGNDELRRLKRIVEASGSNASAPAIIIINTPLFAPPIVGDLQKGWRQLTSVLKKAYAENLRIDPESWDITPASWVALAREVMSDDRFRRSVILAGDVHFSYLAEGVLNHPTSGVRRCLQVTSSPANNETAYLHHLALFPHLPFYQAVWDARGGFFTAISPTHTPEEMVRAIAKVGRTSQPYIKSWLGLRSDRAKPDIVTENNFAMLRVLPEAVDVKLVNSVGEIVQHLEWR